MIALRTTVLILFLISLVHPVWACSCAFAGPPCQAAREPSAVFVGRVRAIEQVKRAQDEYRFYGRRVRFEIIDAFTGVSGGAAEVYTGHGGGDCGYGFRTGGTYLVYAYRGAESPNLTTGICSRTRPVSDAEEDLSYLRTRNDPARGSGIEGHAFRLKRDKNGNTHWDEYAEGVSLLVEGNSRSWELKTGKGGKFALWHLAPGTYRLRGRDPKAYIVSLSPETVELSGSGCAHVTVMLTPEP